MAFRKKGQGSTEYLVILAVVLVVALVSIGLLGFFPGLSTDAKITQSASYWKGARPFAILEHTMTYSGGTGVLIIQNMDASGTLVLNSITLTTAAGSNTTSPGYAFAPGEIRNVTVGVTPGAGSGSGRAYDVQVMLNYTSANGLISAQIGGPTKTLIGKYL